MAKVFRWIEFACGLATNLALAQNQPPITAPPPLPFTAQIKKAVVFIQTECRSPQGIENVVGTGFLLLMPDPRLRDNRGFSYLITNRHVVQPGIENSKPCDVASYYIRLNLKARANGQPGSQLVP